MKNNINEKPFKNFLKGFFNRIKGYHILMLFYYTKIAYKKRQYYVNIYGKVSIL